MSIETQFNQAALRAKNLPSQDNATLLKIYALYKQASGGDVSGPAPGTFDFKGKAKYDAWKALKGLSRQDAMEQYIALIAKLTPDS